MEKKAFRSRQSANAVAALALMGSIAVGLIYAGEQQASHQAGPWLVAAAQAQSSRSAAVSKSSPGDRPIRINRTPIRTIKDDGAVFTAVAVDPVRDEIVLQDEANQRIYAYNRLDNTPAAARMTEPKRTIGGNNTKIADNCGIYVDPRSGDIYSITGDTSDNMLVFTHEAKGNVPPVRELKTPHRMFGIAANEETDELYIATQWPPAVFVYRKEAEGKEAPVRILEGPNTKLAGAMGVALDTKHQGMYVGNWGATSATQEGMGYSGLPVYGEGKYRTWDLPDGLQLFFRKRMVPGSGTYTAPFIASFPIKASGNVAPERIIQGSNTHLDWPGHMYMDMDRQELYVANTMDHSILVFRATDSGNAAPIRAIKGDKTDISYPVGVFFDAKNQEIVVSNWGNHAATVYRRDANGNTPPIRKIRTAPEGTPSPMLSHLGAMTYDSKRDEIVVDQ